MGLRVEREVNIWLPDQISGPFVEWRSAIKRVAMFLGKMEGQRGEPPLSEYYASSKGQCWNLEAALFKDCPGSGAEGPLVTEDLRP